MNEDAESPALRRVIRLPQAIAMVVGTIVGSSIFVQLSDVTRLVPSVSGILWVWVLSGVLTLFGALVCAELASIYTRSGGVYVYLSEAFSPAVGFLWGWAMFWVMHSGIIAAMSMICARYVAFFHPMSSTGIKGIAIVCILILSAVNYAGVKPGSNLQTAVTFAKLIAIALLIVAGFMLGSRVPGHFVAGTGSVGSTSLKSFLLAMVAGLFTYGGWHMVGYNAEETVKPQKTIPRALLFGTLIVMACYVAMNGVYLYLLPLDKVTVSTQIAAEAANVVVGRGGGALMSILVVFSTFGAVSGIILAGPRVYYAMAKDGLLFSWAGSIHPKYRTPASAIVLQAIWSCVLVATGTYRSLFTRVVYTEWMFFGLMAVGLLILRRRPAVVREYSVWGYPIVPILFAIFSFVIVINQMISSPRESAVGLGLVLAGLPVYFFWVRRSKR
ncbi:MAG: amino acid permease [Acidobacteriia bacterium]|nr:amino acid permease [Terriglobia bacterium]